MTEERDSLGRDKPYALYACLLEDRRMIKRLRVMLGQQAELVKFNGRAVEDYRQRLPDSIKRHADNGA